MHYSLKGKRRFAGSTKDALKKALIVLLIVLQFEGILVFLSPSPAQAAALTIASSASETGQVTTSTTYTNSDATIASGSLPAGTYLVNWGAAISNSSANEVTFVRLVRGATVIAELAHEAAATASAIGGRSVSGYWLGTLSGSEALTIQYRVSSGIINGYIDSKFIKAVRLDTSLTVDADYWTTGSQEAGTDEVANAATTGFTTVKTLTKTFDATNPQDYIILASMEISADSTTNDCDAKLVVDGIDMMMQTQEGEDITDLFGYVVSDVRTLGTGSKTITLQGQSVGTATCDFLRSRIYVFRANIFDQVVENESLGESTLGSSVWTTKNTLTYTPNQAEDVLVLSNRMLGVASGVSGAGATRINNTTDAVFYAETMAHAINNQVPDYYTGMSAASLNMSTAKTFTQDYQRAAGSGSMKIKEARLIMWSMTLRDPATYSQSGYRWFNNTVGTGASGAWWDAAWKNRRKITFDNSQSSENLANFPVRVSLVGSSTNSSGNIDYSKTQGAGQDIRFIDANGSTVLKHEIEKWDETGTSEVWVNVPQIDSGSTTDFIWMYYNNAGASDGQDVANTWNSAYKGVWHLDEDPTGTTPAMKDSTASAYHGTSVSMEASDQNLGAIDGSLQFDGTDGATGEMIDIGKQTNLFSATAYTVSCWINTPTIIAGEKHYFTDVSSTAGSASVDMYLSNASTPVFIVNDAGVAVGAQGTVVVGGQWYFFTGVMTNPGDTATLTLYRNGQADGAPATLAGAMPANNTNTGKLGIAGPPDYTGAIHFPGTIDECRYSNTNRSAEWIEADYKTQSNQMNTFAAEEADADYSPLAAANTSYQLTSAGQDFRLRLLLHVANDSVFPGETSFKLQVASKSGTCDTAYSGETYADVATGSGAIRYNDNAGETDNGPMVADADDPTHSTDAVIPQTYEEANNFTNTSFINRGEDGEWEFALTDFSAPASTAYCFRVVTSGGSAIATPGVVPEIISAGGGNVAPASPTSLVQKKTDDTVLATGDWTNETSIKLTATVTDSDGGDTIKICAEVDPIATAFSSPAGDGDGCSVTGVATGNTATVTISGLSDNTEYHWQIKAKDAAGLYSSWVTYGGNTENPPTNPAARDFATDATAPTGGTVFDGTNAGVDATFNDGSLSTLSANWSGFSAGVSGLLRYDYSIGTTAGATDIKAWTANGTTTSVTATGLTLQTSQLYFVNVRAVDNAGNVQTAISSNGQMVAPNLSFAISPTSLTFANLNAANSYTDSKATTLTTSTNAFNGYVVRLSATDFLRSGSFTIPDFSGGTYALPDSWQGGDTGFGYTSSDTLVQGINKFQSATCPGGSTLAAPGCFAPYSQIKPGDIVADNTGPVTASPVTITHRVTTPATQAARSYAVVLIYAITALY